jgi:hypothetical protein
VEGVLERALFEAGMISEANYGDFRKTKWARSSRTDKGVHSLCTVGSARERGAGTLGGAAGGRGGWRGGRRQRRAAAAIDAWNPVCCTVRPRVAPLACCLAPHT